MFLQIQGVYKLKNGVVCSYTHKPDSKVVKLVGKEKAPTRELLTPATLQLYTLFSSSPVTVTELPVVLTLTGPSSNWYSITSMSYLIIPFES